VTSGDVAEPWRSLFAAVAELAQPLLDAGWILIETVEEASWEYGDSVFWVLERAGEGIDLEYYDHGQLVVYPSEPAGDDEPTMPLFAVDDATIGRCRDAFHAQGWL
jgi:hypothetical protein